MNIENSLLKSEEEIIFSLRKIYRSHGFRCYKMGKFEEYDLYAQNKDFLISDSVITFTDTNGKLMALKPDVTLSIVKNYRPKKEVTRVYYDESVYRISEQTHAFKEIMQTGVEALGELSDFNFLEVIALAAESLFCISKKSVLNLSHLGILDEILKEVASPLQKKKLLNCVRTKNQHEASVLCREFSVSPETERLLCLITSLSGTAESVAERFAAETENPVLLSAVEELCQMARRVEKISKVPLRIDLSLVGDIGFYNGFVFQGYIEGVPMQVLSGGQYDKLMQKMQRQGRAIGFAVYLDRLSRLKNTSEYDVDVLLRFGDDDDVLKVYKKAQEMIAEGKRVLVQKDSEPSLSYREEIRFGGERENG